MIQNDEIILRAVEPNDVELLYDWENRMELWSVSNTLTPFSKAQLFRYVKNAALDMFQTKQLRLMIDACNLHDRPLTVGMIDLFDYDPFHNRAGVGIMVNSEWRGRGVAASALQLFMTYAFNTLGLHQLYCHISESNAASIKLFESAGFRLVGVKQEWLKTSKGYEDELMFQCLKEDFR
jgi:diamine N-acetyltransferase